VLKQGLYNRLSDEYLNHSFKLIRSKGLFQRAEFAVHWGGPVVYSDSLNFQPRLSVNNKIIFDVLSIIFPHAKNLTIFKVQGCELAKEMGVPNEEKDEEVFYKVENSEDFKSVVDDHMGYMEKVGFKFFDKLASLEGVNDFINRRILEGDNDYFKSKNQQASLKKFFDKREVLSGVTSAYLTNSPKKNVLLERYRILFEGNDYILSDVQKIEDHFTKIS